MKKLLHVVESTATGTLSVLLDLCAFQSKYYEIMVAYGVRQDTPANVEELFRNISSKIKLYKVESFTRSIRPDKDVKAFLEMKHILLAWRPDIVHLHSSKAGALGRLLLLSPKVVHCLEKRADGSFPVFYTPHGYSFLQSTDSAFKCHVYHFTEAVLGKMKANTIACSRWEYGVAARLTSRAGYVNNGIHTEEIDTLKDMWSDNGKMKEENRMKQQFARWRQAGKCIVYISGRITAARSPVLFNQIAQQCPSMQFVWIGDGECRNLLTADNIYVTGWVSRQDGLGMASMADVFLLPSLWEGLSISLLEAMYLKKLCVVSDIAQNCAVITQGVTGCVCHAPEDYVRVLNEVNDSGQVEGIQVSSMVEHARQRILEGYTRESMAKGYMDIYEEKVN